MSNRSGAIGASAHSYSPRRPASAFVDDRPTQARGGHGGGESQTLTQPQKSNNPKGSWADSRALCGRSAATRRRAVAEPMAALRTSPSVSPGRQVSRDGRRRGGPHDGVVASPPSASRGTTRQLTIQEERCRRIGQARAGGPGLPAEKEDRTAGGVLLAHGSLSPAPPATSRSDGPLPPAAGASAAAVTKM